MLALLLAAADPVAAVRVTFDRAGETSARTSGFADVAAGRRVTADDPVRVASISKLVVGIAVLRLVEQGQLDLDADVSDMLGWWLRNPGFPDTPVTLRLLLSHQSSLSDGIDYALPLDGELRAALANPAAWDRGHAPGRWFRYANLNFPVVAAVMEQATGERFDQLMDRLVLKPLRLSACFNWTTCGDATVARAVVLYRDGAAVRDDLHGQRPACPVTPTGNGSCDLSAWRAGVNGAIFSPQGGLRISMRDLAKIGRFLLSDGAVDGARLLSRRSMRMLATPVWTFDGGNGWTGSDAADPAAASGFDCRYGLAVSFTATRRGGCRNDPFGDGRERSGHAGDAYGVRSGLWVDRRAGTGIAYFATGVAEGAPRSRSAFTDIEVELARGERP